ncbi:hypothetical protein Slin15195_G081380 [Septoria linicola]|uniref:Zn(2)-C6 fungal-type domain-containing protein n=1 Tax=Septoria linicola TaxID=215465 RepID=A0A9Q9AU46_9PEZI|nr:hypothetical protein Slin15195_G081380 [Septoria linicola]
MDSGSSRRQHSSALPAENLLSSLAKRTPARAACERCRRRKIRCEGERPCSKCIAAKAECVCTTQQHETERQAAKRRFNEITTSHEQLRKVHEFLVGASQDNASTALRLLRDQKSLEHVLTWIASLDQSISQSHQQLNYQEFATALVQSTAPLQDLVGIAELVFNPTQQYNLPSRDALAALQDRIISLGDVLGVLAQSNPTSDTSLLSTFTAVESLCSADDNELELRLHWVPASPWLDSRIAERGVSRLISTFIWTVNPYWRLLEADLFLRHMRTRKLDSLYCSPLLVNAVLACAAMFSEDEEAFTNPGDLLTRGEQYHNEATRLWQAERGRESIATLQALIILSCESAWRGQDRLGWTYRTAAIAMSKLLAESPPLHVAADPWTVQNYPRAISCARSTIMWLHLGWTVDLFRKPKDLKITIDELPDLEKVLVDTPSLWAPYLISGQLIRYHPNLLALERQSLCQLLWSMLRFTPEDITRARFWTDLKDLGRRLDSWHSNLPEPLQRTSLMPPPLYEFYANSCYLLITFHDHWAEALSPKDPRGNREQERYQLKRRQHTIQYCLSAASLLKDYRECCGLEAVQPWLFQLAATAAFVLLRNLDRHALADMDRDESEDDESSPESTTHNSQCITALEECCRCLLACGMQSLLFRSVTRTLSQAAAKSKARLLESVQKMLEVFGRAI